VNEALSAYGGDAGLAAVVALHGGARIRFVPDGTSDLARALGLGVGESVREPATIDALDVDRVGAAVNMVVLGPGPDRLRRRHRRHPCRVEIDGRVAWEGNATTVLVANGEYLRAQDVVPRGHPGDGRLEVQVYAVAPTQRASMRGRLATGTHLPHPQIRTAQGRHVGVRWDRPVRLEVDGVDRGATRAVEVAIRPGAATLV
jgi:hypothetical protein